MATFAQLYYSGNLPLKGDKVKSHKAGGMISGEYLEADAYDLSNVEFFKNDSSEFANNISQ